MVIVYRAGGGDREQSLIAAGQDWWNRYRAVRFFAPPPNHPDFYRRMP